MCPSEVSDIDESVYKVWRDQGVQVWAISSEPRETLEAFRDALDIEMPILMDPGEQALRQYRLLSPFPTGAYPHDFVISPDGTIVYANNRFERDGMIAALEATLE